MDIKGVANTEKRKYYTQMTEKELKMLSNLIKDKEFTLTAYSRGRIQKRDIDENQVKRAIKDGKILEFHYKDGDIRVLIRGSTNESGNNICVVVNLRNQEIVTSYPCAYNDNHITLDMNIYDRNFDITKYL
jgi:hypothetical protein